ETVSIDSASTITGTPTATGAPTSGGLLFSPTDVGKHSRDRISFPLEANIKIGYEFCNWLRAYVGYDVLYVTNVARSGDQSAVSTLNTTIQVANTTNHINVSHPTFP